MASLVARQSGVAVGGTEASMPNDGSPRSRAQGKSEVEIRCGRPRAVELLRVCVDLGEIELRCELPAPGWRPAGSLLALLGARAAGGRRSPPPASGAAVEERTQFEIPIGSLYFGRSNCIRVFFANTNLNVTGGGLRHLFLYGGSNLYNFKFI
jgi:hypothetical protein